MAVRGEIKCVSCGRVLAFVEGRDVGPLRLVRNPQGPVAMRRRGSSLFCGRCGGRAFLENLERVPLAA